MWPTHTCSIARTSDGSAKMHQGHRTDRNSSSSATVRPSGVERVSTPDETDIDLTDRGRHQADAIRVAVTGLPIDETRANPLRRAWDTATLIGLDPVCNNNLLELPAAGKRWTRNPIYQAISGSP